MFRAVAAAVTAVAVAASMPAMAKAGPPQAPGASYSYTDAAHDAYKPPAEAPAGGVPVEVLSDPAFDVLRVSFAPVETKKKFGDGYLASMEIAGTARPDGSYVSAGTFVNAGGEECQLYHFLTPGTTALANAFCGDGDARRLVGQLHGGLVEAQATPSGGTTLSAAFENRKLPADLIEAGRSLAPLFAYTCVQGLEGRGCRPSEKIDVASDSSGSYQV